MTRTTDPDPRNGKAPFGGEAPAAPAGPGSPSAPGRAGEERPESIPTGSVPAGFSDDRVPSSPPDAPAGAGLLGEIPAFLQEVAPPPPAPPRASDGHGGPAPGRLPDDLLRARYRPPGFAAVLFKIALMIALCVALGLLLARIHRGAGDGVRKATSRMARPFLPALKDRYHILLLGTDKLIDINRTDTMILALVNTKDHAVDAVSVLRDTWTEELPIKVKKLNGVYANALIRFKRNEPAALERTRDVVSRLLGVPVDHYIRVDLDGFVRVVDLIGGVDIFVDRDMKYDDFSQNLHINLKKGYQRLDGEKAQQFVRFRSDADGDRARAARQQRFLHALLQRLTSPAVLLNLPDVVRGALAEIATDLPLDTALALANHFLASDRVALATHTIPGDYGKRDELDYFFLDKKRNRALFDELLDPERFANRSAPGATGEVSLPSREPAPEPAPKPAPGPRGEAPR